MTRTLTIAPVLWEFADLASLDETVLLLFVVVFPSNNVLGYVVMYDVTINDNVALSAIVAGLVELNDVTIAVAPEIDDVFLDVLASVVVDDDATMPIVD